MTRIKMKKHWNKFVVSSIKLRLVLLYCLCLVSSLSLPMTTYPGDWRRNEIYGGIWLATNHIVRSGKRDDDVETDPRDMPPGTVVWIYLRHSPGDNQSLESQEAAINKLVIEKEWNIGRIFRDRAVSGKSTRNREAFELMIHLARQTPRQADMIIVWEYSRFARNQIDSQLYRAELRKNGWSIFSMNDDIPSGPLSQVFEALIDWKNEQFLIDLRASTIRGLRYIADQGCLPGGTVAKGYIYIEIQIEGKRDGEPRMGRKPVSDPETEALIVKAFEMKANGAPYEAIAKATGLYSPKSGSWNSFFRNRNYIGEYEFRGEVYKDIYPAIISNELFDAVQKRLPKRKEQKLKGKHHPRRKGSSFFLANISICAFCGKPMEGKSTGRYRYYVCAMRNESKERCPNSSLIQANLVETEILHVLLNQILVSDYLKRLLNWTNERLNSGREDLTLHIKNTQAELVQAERMVLKMTRNFGMAERPTPTMERILHDHEQTVLDLQAKLAELEEELAYSRIETSSEQIELYVQQSRALIDKGEFFDLRELCEQLCSRIVMATEECLVEIHFPVI